MPKAIGELRETEFIVFCSKEGVDPIKLPQICRNSLKSTPWAPRILFLTYSAKTANSTCYYNLSQARFD
jgi:hypothetical protein